MLGSTKDILQLVCSKAIAGKDESPSDLHLPRTNGWWRDAAHLTKILFEHLTSLARVDPECQEVFEMELATAADTPESRDRSLVIRRIQLGVGDLNSNDSIDMVRASLAKELQPFLSLESNKSISSDIYKLVGVSITVICLLTKPNWASSLRNALAENFREVLGDSSIRKAIAAGASSIRDQSPELREVVDLALSPPRQPVLPVSVLFSDLSEYMLQNGEIIAGRALELLREARMFFQELPERIAKIGKLLVEVKSVLRPSDTESNGTLLDLFAQYRSTPTSHTVTSDRITEVLSPFIDVDQLTRISLLGPSNELMSMLEGLNQFFSNIDNVRAIESYFAQRIGEFYEASASHAVVDQAVSSGDQAFSRLASLAIKYVEANRGAEVNDKESSDDLLDSKIKLIRRPSRNTPEGAFFTLRELIQSFASGHKLWTSLHKVTKLIIEPHFAGCLPAENFIPALCSLIIAHSQLKTLSAEDISRDKHAGWIKEMLASVIRHSNDGTHKFTKSAGHAKSSINFRDASNNQPIEVLLQGEQRSQNGFITALNFFVDQRPQFLGEFAEALSKAISKPEDRELQLSQKIFASGQESTKVISQLIWSLAYTRSAELADQITTAIVLLADSSSSLESFLGNPDSMVVTIMRLVTIERERLSLCDGSASTEALRSIQTLGESFARLTQSTSSLSGNLLSRLQTIYTESWRDKYRDVTQQESNNLYHRAGSVILQINGGTTQTLSPHVLPPLDTPAGLILECRNLQHRSRQAPLLADDLSELISHLEGDKGARLLHEVPAEGFIDELLQIVSDDVLSDTETSQRIAHAIAAVAIHTRETSLEFVHIQGVTEQGMVVPTQPSTSTVPYTIFPDGASVVLRKLRDEMVCFKEAHENTRLLVLRKALLEASSEIPLDLTLAVHRVVPYDVLLLILGTLKHREPQIVSHNSQDEVIKAVALVLRLCRERSEYKVAFATIISQNPVIVEAEFQTLNLNVSMTELLRELLEVLSNEDFITTPKPLLTEYEFSEIVRIIVANPFYKNIVSEMRMGVEVSQHLRSRLLTLESDIFEMEKQPSNNEIYRLANQVKVSPPVPPSRDSLLSIEGNPHLKQFSLFVSSMRQRNAGYAHNSQDGQEFLRRLIELTKGTRAGYSYNARSVFAVINDIDQQYSRRAERIHRSFSEAVKTTLPEGVTLVALECLVGLRKLNNQSGISEFLVAIQEWSKKVTGSITVKRDNLPDQLISLSPAETILFVLRYPVRSPLLHDEAMRVVAEALMWEGSVKSLTDISNDSIQICLNTTSLLLAFTSPHDRQAYQYLCREIASAIVDQDCNLKDTLIELLSPRANGTIGFVEHLSAIFNESPGIDFTIPEVRRGVSQTRTPISQKYPVAAVQYQTEVFNQARSAIFTNLIDCFFDVIVKDSLQSGDVEQANKHLSDGVILSDFIASLPNSMSLERALVFQLTKSDERARIAAQMLSNRIGFSIPEWIESDNRRTFSALLNLNLEGDRM